MPFTNGASTHQKAQTPGSPQAYHTSDRYFHQSSKPHPYYKHSTFNTTVPTGLYPSVSSFRPTMARETPSPYRDFEPNGTELQRYTPEAPIFTPPSTTSPSPVHMAQLQRYVLSNHFGNTKDIAALERKSRNQDEEIAKLKEVFSRDMQALQSEIIRLGQTQSSGPLTKVSRADQIRDPPEEFGKKEAIAEAYLDEAEDFEAAAKKLRSEASKICEEIVRERESDAKVEVKADSDPATQFACCGDAFESLGGMLEHVRDAHASSIEGRGRPIMANGHPDTPTHMPSRRAQGAKDESKPKVQCVEAQPSKEQANEEAALETTKQIHSTESDDHAQRGTTASVDANVPNTTDTRTADAKTWQPLAVVNMPTPPAIDATNHDETFTFDFIRTNFGGSEWSPGFYFIPHRSDLPSNSYWLLDAATEPYLPSSPGQHGAKLTAFFNESAGKGPEESNYLHVPVFIRAEGEEEYRYFGNYSQNRFSDNLDHERVMAVPQKVRRYWAKQLASPSRPSWVTEALLNHFWPQPTYTGPIPTDSALASPATLTKNASDAEEALEKKVTKSLSKYASELKDWRKEAEMKVSYLNEDALFEAFGKADADEEPGLRLWWEWFECVGYDEGFYDFLVTLKRNPGLQKDVLGMGKGGKKSASKSVEKKIEVGGRTVKPEGSGVETVRPPPAKSASKPVPLNVGAQGARNRPSHLHLGGSKPWEAKEKKAAEDATAPADAWLAVDEAPTVTNREQTVTTMLVMPPQGDLEAAKEMQKSFTRAQPARKGGIGKVANVAPHLRKANGS